MHAEPYASTLPEEARTPRTALLRSAPAVVERLVTTSRLELMEPESGRRFTAQVASLGYDAPRIGDRVLYATDDRDAKYVIGVLSRASLSALEEALEADARRSTSHIAHLEDKTDLIVAYDEQTKRTTLSVPAGDLAIEVAHGAFSVSARDGVRLASENTVDLTVETSDAVAARVSLTKERTTILGRAVTLAGTTAEVLASRVAIRAHFFDSHVDRVRQVANVIDVEATRIIERARDSYREVSGLSQHRAGRLRWVAEKTASLVGENVLLRARDRMKVDGERIHLA